MPIHSNCSLQSIQQAALSLSKGGLVAFPTETVYGLGADSINQEAIARLYKVKARPLDHPLIVHLSNISLLDMWARQIPEYAINLARAFWPGPMTLVLPRADRAEDFITGGQDNVAIRIPSHPVAVELLREFEKLGGFGVAAPSANRFGKVSPTTAVAVEMELGQYLSSSDQILDGGLSQIGVESTIIDCSQVLPVILRPGGVTVEMMRKVLDIKLDQRFLPSKEIKAPGMLTSHYSPNAKIFLSGTPSPGDGYIAMANISTPEGAIRLASPKDNHEYAQILYESLRSADSQGLKHLFVVPPDDSGVGSAINDRLAKAANQ